MRTEHVQLTKENREDFESVFPSAFRESANRISIGAYREDGAVLGAISFVLVNDQIEIDWLYVIPEMRRHGVATGLIREFQKLVIFTGERYPVSARFPVTEEDVSLHRFFLSLSGVEVSYSHDRFYVTAEDIREAVPLHRSAKRAVEVENFFDAKEDWQKKVLHSLERTYGFSTADYEEFQEDCVKELCLYLAVQGNLLSGIFVQRSGDRSLELTWLYGSYPPGLFLLLGKTAQEAERLFPEDSLTFEAINEKSEKLAKHLFPEARSVSIYEAQW